MDAWKKTLRRIFIVVLVGVCICQAQNISALASKISLKVLAETISGPIVIGDKVYTGGQSVSIEGSDGYTTITVGGNTLVSNSTGQYYVYDEAGGSSIMMTGGMIRDIYGSNGSIAISGGSVNTVYGQGSVVSVEGSASVNHLYGGGNLVAISGGNVGTVYGEGAAVAVNGGSVIMLYGDGAGVTVSEGANVVTLYGGSNSADVASTYVEIAGGNVTNLYGGGNSGGVSGETNIVMTGGTVVNLYGGSDTGTVGSVKLAISGGTVTGEVYGDSLNGGEVTGNVQIDISGTANAYRVTGVRGSEPVDGVNGYITAFVNCVENVENLLWFDGTTWRVRGNVILPESVNVSELQEMILGEAGELATLTVPEGLTLHVEDISTLTGNGELLGAGEFTTATFMPEMLTGCESLVYTGEDLSKDISLGTINVLGAEFCLEGEYAANWDKSFTCVEDGVSTAVEEVVDVGDYTLVFSKEGMEDMTRDFSVVRSHSAFEEGSIHFYKGENGKEIVNNAIPVMDSFSIMVTAPYANGVDAETEGEEYSELYAPAQGGQLEVYLDTVRIAGELELQSENAGYVVPDVNISSLTALTLSPEESHTITVKYLGDDNMAACETTIDVMLTTEVIVTGTDGTISHHSTLSSAVESAQASEGSVVTVYANDMVLESPITINGGNFTINMNGNTISSNLSEPAITINGAEVVFQGGGRLANIGNAALAVWNGNVVVEDSVFSGNSSQGAIAYKGGILSMQGNVRLNNGGSYPDIYIGGTNPIVITGELSGGPYSVSGDSRTGVFAAPTGSVDTEMAAEWFVSAVDGYLVVAEGDSLCLKEDINRADVIFTPFSGVYNGENQMPIVEALINGNVLTQNQDYTLQFTNEDGVEVDELTAVGTYMAILTGIGDYTGCKTAAYIVDEADNNEEAITLVYEDGDEDETENTLEKNYSYLTGGVECINLKELLPADCGSVTYSQPQVTAEHITFKEGPTVSGGDLIYTVDAGKWGASGSIEVVATTENYDDIVLTIKINLVGEKAVEVKPGSQVAVAKSPVYGDTLGSLAFYAVTFVEKGTAMVVSGTLEWKEPNTVLQTGTVTAQWIFTPNDEEYPVLEGSVDLNVEKATPDVETDPVVEERVYHPTKVLVNDDIKGGNVTGVDGNVLKGAWSWKDTGVIPVVENKGYEMIFTPEDTTNYKPASIVLEVEVSMATPYIAQKPTASGIVMGQTLADSVISGGIVYHSSESQEVVSGSFAWEDGTEAPEISDSGDTEYGVVFTPTDQVNYESVETALTIEVASLGNPPNMPATTMNVSSECEVLGDVELPEGWEWSEDETDTELPMGEAMEFTAYYTGEDADAYEIIEVVVIITRGKCNHKAGEILYDGDGENAPTCTEKGLGHKECTICGSVIKENISVKALGHKYTKKVTKKPTTTEKGIATYTCSVCGHSYKETIDKLPGGEQEEKPGDGSDKDSEDDDEDEPEDNPDDKPQENKPTGESQNNTSVSKPAATPKKTNTNKQTTATTNKSQSSNKSTVKNNTNRKEEATASVEPISTKEPSESKSDKQVTPVKETEPEATMETKTEIKEDIAETSSSEQPKEATVEPEAVEADSEFVSISMSLGGFGFIVFIFVVGVGVGILCMQVAKNGDRREA